MPRKEDPDGRQRRHYTREQKRLIVYQRDILGKSTTQIAIDLDMPLRVVQRVLQMWDEVGEVCKDRKKIGRAPLMKGDHVRVMLALLERDPTLYLDEIQEQLEEMHGISVSLCTVWRTLKTLGMSSKKLSKAARERSAEARRDYLLTIGQFRADQLVFVDESHVNILTTYRENGWSPIGTQAHQVRHFVRGTRYSLLPALAVDGLVYSHVKVGGYSGDDFITWLEGLLECMNPYPQPRSVLVLDNCSIHHVDGVQEMCDAKGVQLVYLPPYSPDLNPIEVCFGWVKAYIRRHGHEFRDAVECGEEADPYIYLYTVLSQVTSECAAGWFKHSRYL